MKTLKMNLSTEDLTLEESDKKKTSTQLATTMYKNIILAWSNQKGGMNEEERRQYYKFCDAIEAAGELAEEVNLEDAHFSILEKAFKEVKAVPNDLFRRLEFLFRG